MKVLFLNHETKIGGGEVTMLDFVRACSCSIVTDLLVPEDGPLVIAAKEAGMKVCILPIDRRLLEVKRNAPTISWGRIVSLTGYVTRLRREINNLKPDVVVSNSMKAHIYGSLALAGTPFRYGWRLHDMVDARSFNKGQKRLINYFARWFPRSIAAVSASCARAIADGGVSNRKIVVLHNGIPEPVSYSRADAEAYRLHLGISEEGIGRPWCAGPFRKASPCPWATAA